LNAKKRQIDSQNLINVESIYNTAAEDYSFVILLGPSPLCVRILIYTSDHIWPTAMPILGRGEQRGGPCTNPTEIDLLVAKPFKSVTNRAAYRVILGKMMMRVFQYSSIARALSLSKSSTIHQATGAPRTKFSCLQQQSRSSSCHLRKTQGEPLVFKTSADKALRYFSLTPTQRYADFSISIPVLLPTVSQITSLAERLKKQPLIAFSPEVCHPMLDRPQEMKKIDEALQKQRKSVKVLYLVGEPGAGKSQIARKYGVNYADRKLSTSTKTVLTLDMSDFRANYCKLGIKLSLSHSVTNGQSLSNVAEEMKKILSARNHWLLIVDNYNSTDYEGFERGMPTTGILHNHSSYSTCLKLNSKYPSDENELYN
jgi:hypothetical protein